MRAGRRVAALTLTWIVATAAGCTGRIADANGPGGTTLPPSIDPDNPTPPPAPDAPSVAPTALARMSQVELANTLRDLFGEPALDSLTFQRTTEGTLVTDVTAVDALGLFSIVETVAERVYASDAVMTCRPATDAERASCTDTIVRALGERVFRRPLTDVEATRYVSKAGEAPTFDEGVRIALTALLASPKFFYKVEVGDASRERNGVRPLTSWEMASRLSYGIWRTMPDDVLFAAARADELRTPEQIQAQAHRLLADPRARETVVRFHAHWLDLASARSVFRDTTEYPAFDSAMPAAWATETEHFVEHVVFDATGSLRELFTAPYTFTDASVAAVYGAGAPDGDGRVALAPERAAGILTQSSLLAPLAPSERTSPIHRGAFVYRKLLCAPLADPPPNVPALPEPDPSLSLRDQITVATSVEPCVSCHGQFNSFGFALGHFDGIGAWLDRDPQDKPVDARVTLPGPSDLAGVTVDGAAELGAALADSAALRDCYVDTWFRYLMGRPVAPSDGDAYSRLLAQYDFEVSDRNVLELLVALMSSDAYRHIRVPID